MNKGYRSWSRPQNVIKIRAVLKLDGSSPPSAGARFSVSTIKNAWNIKQVIFNATGDYTVHFERPMADAHFIVQGCAKASGGTELNVNISTSDTGVNDRVRIFTTSSAGGGAVDAPHLHLIIFQ